MGSDSGAAQAVVRMPINAHSLAALAVFAEQWQVVPPAFWSVAQTLAWAQEEAARLYVLAQDQQWVACALVQAGVDSGDLLYLYVPPATRRRGYGRALLQQLLTQIAAAGEWQQLLLEVRPANHAAVTLYQSLGATSVGQRRRYYVDGEDALVLAWTIRAERG